MMADRPPSPVGADEPACVWSLLSATAAAKPDQIAIIDPLRSLTYAELALAVDQFAAALRNRGLKPGDCVTLYGENAWQWIVTYYAILRCGGIVNPVNALNSADELAYIMADCGASLLICAARRSAHLANACPRIVYGEAAPEGATTFESLLANQTNLSPPASPTRPDDLAMICYTSGTTGRPKGAMLTHQNVITNALMTALMHGRTDGDIVVSALPLPHVYGTVVLNSAIAVGASLVVFAAFDPQAVLAAITTHRATVFDGVPTMYYYLLRALDEAPADLSSLRLCTVGGQTIPVAKIDEVERRFNCPLIELWGMTELAGVGVTHAFTGPRKRGAIGVAIPFVEARTVAINDPAQECARGEVGELAVRGAIVMAGYLNNDAATRETITPDGWLLTGDLAARDQAGFFTIVDRKKDMILTAGYNVYPAELERVLAAHPDVSMVAVSSVPDAEKGEIAKAYIVLREGAAPDPDGLLAFCRQHLAAYKLPRRFAFVPDLPKTGSGKILRRSLHLLDQEQN